jgi:hypothetical protein
MSYGIYLPQYIRPNSKKEIKECVKLGRNIVLENTSAFGDNYDGGLDTAPDGEYNFVGPCPYTNRKFYGIITKKAGKVTVE